MTCLHCKHVFEADERYLLKPGKKFDFYTCPACEKPVRRLIAPPPAAAPPPGWLVVGDAHAAPQRLPLRVGDNLVGRYSADTEVSVPLDTTDTSVSRRHCVVTVARDDLRGTHTFRVRDCGSTNKVFINERTAKSQLAEQDVEYLSDGDKLLLGETQVILEVNQLANFAPSLKAGPNGTIVQRK